MSLGISLDAQIQINQDSTYIFEMKDGNVYIGKVVDFKKGEMYDVQTSVGNIKILQKHTCTGKNLIGHMMKMNYVILSNQFRVKN